MSSAIHLLQGARIEHDCYDEQDALGNVMGTHTGTSVTESIEYDAWGVPSASGDLSSRLMWKGLLWEGDVVGLYYMRGRWYDPELGRFIQEDPIELAGGINLYAFAHNDPVNGNDPRGLDPGIDCEVSIAAWLCAYYSDPPSLPI